MRNFLSPLARGAPAFYTPLMNIVLIGYRGSGKSSIGRKLAHNLWLDFVDTDALIVERAGKNIRDIFNAEGETGFRDRESAVIQEISARENLVIAAGGGAILRPENVAALKKNSKIIWLKADAKTLHARIVADTETLATRPSLTHLGGTVEEVTTLLEERTPLYAAAAEATLEVGYLTVEEAAARLVLMV